MVKNRLCGWIFVVESNIYAFVSKIFASTNRTYGTSGRQWRVEPKVDAGEPESTRSELEPLSTAQAQPTLNGL